MANRHVRNLRGIGGVEMLSVCGSKIEKSSRFSKQHHIPFAYSDIDEMLQKHEPDILVVASSTPLHYIHVRKGLEHDCHIFCEKPLCESLDEGLELLQVRERHERKFMVGFSERFRSDFRAVKNLMNGKRINPSGGIFIRHSTSHPKQEWYGNLEAPLISEFATHAVDWILWIKGELPKMVQAYERRALDDENRLSLFARLEFQDRSTAYLISSFDASIGEIYTLGGDGFSIEVFKHRVFINGKKVFPRFYDIPARFIGLVSDSYKTEMDYFIKAVKKNRPISPDLFDGLRALLVARAIQIAVKTSRPVSIEDSFAKYYKTLKVY